MKKGLVHVYTGDGEGKTTAAFGLALRALGRNLRVFVIQFLKGEGSGEVLALRRLGVEVELFGRKEFVDPRNIQPEDLTLAKKGLERAKEVIQEGGYDLVILDEINIALKFTLLNLNDVLDLVKNKPSDLELILTGWGAPLKLLELADLVTEMKKIKHPFDKGISARKGFDY